MRSPALAGSRRWSALRQGGWSITDQVLSSGTQLLLVVLVARRSSAALFGAVSVGVIVHGFLLGGVRALIGDVVLIRCRRPGAVVSDEARTGLFLVGAVAIGCAAALAFAGRLIGGEVGPFLLLFAVGVPVVHAQDLLRSVAYGSSRIVRAVLIDATWLVVQVVLTAVLLLRDDATARSLVGAWVLGAAAGLALGLAMWRCRPERRRAAAWVHDDGSRAVGFLGDYLVSTGVVQASFVALGAMFSLAEFGRFRLAYVSISPLANVTAGVRSLVLARLAGLAAAPRAAFRTAQRAVPVLAVLGAAYGVVLVAAPVGAGTAVFGPTWTSARDLVAVIAIGETFRLATFPAIDVLRVFASPVRLVRTRGVASVGLVTGILVGGAVAGPRGAVGGTALATALAFALWWNRAAHLAGDATGPPSVPVPEPVLPAGPLLRGGEARPGSSWPAAAEIEDVEGPAVG